MNKIQLLKHPPYMLERSEQLYDLVQNKRDNDKTRLSVANVARFFDMNADTLRHIIRNGGAPFALCDISAGRVVSYIDAYMFYMYVNQSCEVLTDLAAQRQAQDAKEGIICK